MKKTIIIHGMMVKDLDELFEELRKMVHMDSVCLLLSDGDNKIIGNMTIWKDD